MWRPTSVPGLELATMAASATWIGEHLHPGSFQVRMIVPDCFEAYARIFFPFAGDYVVRDGRVVDNERITWAEMARRNERLAHALMEQETISVRKGIPDSVTVYNGFGIEQYDAMFPTLTAHTESDHGWFLFWDGFGDVDPEPFLDQPKVHHQGRTYFLLRGPLEAYGDFPHEPGYFWPEDRAWCLCTDIDFAWGYLAGTAACVLEILATPVIDAYQTEPTNPARSGMDILNDPYGVVPRHP